MSEPTYTEELVETAQRDEQLKAGLDSAFKRYLDAKVEILTNGSSAIVKKKIHQAIHDYLKSYATMNKPTGQFSQEIAFELTFALKEILNS